MNHPYEFDETVAQEREDQELQERITRLGEELANAIGDRIISTCKRALEDLSKGENNSGVSLTPEQVERFWKDDIFRKGKYKATIKINL
jgi:hypothetical protein